MRNVTVGKTLVGVATACLKTARENLPDEDYYEVMHSDIMDKLERLIRELEKQNG